MDVLAVVPCSVACESMVFFPSYNRGVARNFGFVCEDPSFMATSCVFGGHGIRFNVKARCGLQYMFRVRNSTGQRLDDDNFWAMAQRRADRTGHEYTIFLTARRRGVHVVEICRSFLNDERDFCCDAIAGAFFRAQL